MARRAIAPARALGLLPSEPAPVVRGAVRLGDVDMLAASDDVRRERLGSYLGAIFQDPMTSLNP